MILFFILCYKISLIIFTITIIFCRHVTNVTSRYKISPILGCRAPLSAQWVNTCMLNKIICMMYHPLLICIFRFDSYVCRSCFVAYRFAVAGRSMVQVWFHWFPADIAKIVPLGASLPSFICRSASTTSTFLPLSLLLKLLNFPQTSYFKGFLLL